MILQEEKHYLTKEWYDKLIKEKEELQKEKLPKVLERLKAAIEQWDISENAEYEAAMQEKDLIESRINEIEQLLKNVEIIKKGRWKSIRYGAVVTLKDKEWRTYKYEIVGSWEIDVLNGKISLKSPLWKALQWKKIGDEIIVDAPKWKYKMSIIDIK